MTIKEQIIKKIISLLTPLRDLYDDEITKILNDLENNNLTSLDNFIYKYYNDTPYSTEILNLIKSLEEKKIISKNYLNIEENSLKNINTFKNNLNNEDEILSLVEESEIEKMRKTILKAQLNYLNNANSFIEELEKMEDFEIYQNLLNLNDIRYIQHSISNLSINTLNKLLNYIENQEEEKHNLINNFTLEVIKRNLYIKNKESN